MTKLILSAAGSSTRIDCSSLGSARRSESVR